MFQKYRPEAPPSKIQKMPKKLKKKKRNKGKVKKLAIKERKRPITYLIGVLKKMNQSKY